MIMKLVILLGVLGIGYCYPPLQLNSAWNEFKLKYGKDYSAEENELRKGIFTQNVEWINEHNAKYEKGQVSFKVQVNKFADKTREEMKRLNGYRSKATMGLRKKRSESLTFPEEDVPDTWDWRDRNAVTAVKDQGQCGSCWTFSTTGSLEGQHYLKTGNLVSLSEQNIVDCAWNYTYNLGCDGGFMEGANQYIIDNDGIDTEVTYPYTGVDGDCKYNSTNRAATIKGWMDLPSYDEDFLRSAVYHVGPISVSMDASHDSFTYYSGGIYYDPACNPWYLDHAVLAVGYGSENGTDYWIITNSWGTDWGESGYIRIIRNRNNACGIASESTYPLV